MAFSEKLYDLRKKGGLSQEQLAEQLGVSRQAVSKWESGKAIPESDTLVSISEYFHVTLDYLMKENDIADLESEPVVSMNNEMPRTDSGKVKRILGIIICISGIVFLIIWGLVSVFIPSTSDQISESSMITIDGNGVFLIICLAAIIAGAVLLLKSTLNK